MAGMAYMTQHGDYTITHNEGCALAELSAFRPSDEGLREAIAQVVENGAASDNDDQNVSVWCHYCGAEGEMSDEAIMANAPDDVDAP